MRRAFVLGAGLGTRLRPVTVKLPKPLIPVFQKRLVTFAFDHLIACGVRNIIVNTHHAAHRWIEFFPEGEYRGVPLHFLHEPILLETGGGIRNAAPLLGGGAFYVYNGDTLTDLPLATLAAERDRTGAALVVALRSSGGPLRVSWDSASGRILDLAGLAGSGVPPAHLFTGHYLADPEIHDFLEPEKIESVIPALIRMIRAGRKVHGVLCDEGRWFDLGDRNAYLNAHHELAGDCDFPRYTPSGARDAAWRERRHPSAEVAPDARVDSATVLGPGVRIGPGARVTGSILLQNSVVGAGAVLERCILCESAEVPAGAVFSERDIS